ncbi:2-dehydro-3-deoxygluconokinase [Paucibacter oligotrophus]|uniref:2-dehydro-3-deoxygluconokinase n=1 Tax=Roseateles oligotrophus TaxID=1769250 RepID=A0A840LBS9_9BURK|nr:sugar kinase [Roseateles oligotrophus]MBB4843648.1 2-dehydro-3-deoxygluconokinase [Roseateles oligotrophus]
MSPRPELLALGECMVELCGETALGAQGSPLRLGYGGDVLNALVSAARLGTRTGFITRVGADPFAPGLLQAWRQEGVDLRHAQLLPGVNGVYFISQLPGGERDFSYRRQGSAAAGLQPDDVPDEALAGARALLLSGITQALSASARAATLKAAQRARALGLWVAYDPNYRPALWAGQGGEAAAREALHEVLPHVNWLLPSAPADLPLLQGLSLPGPALALKCGAEGVRLQLPGGGMQVLPAVPVTHIVDSTGAGDAWNGAFLHGLLRQAGPEEAALLANQVAARSLGFRGAIPGPAPHPSLTSH